MNHNIRRFSYLCLFVTIEVILGIVPFLGFVPIGLINATTMHIPVILSGIMLGPKEGMITGFVFGLMSMIKSTINPTPTSFLFSPFYSINGLSGSMISLLIAFGPRILIGFVSGYTYRLLKKKENIAVMVSSFLGSLTNTALVMTLTYIFFAYALAISKSVDAIAHFIITVIMTNGVAEAFLAVVIVLMVYKATKKMIKL